MSQQTTPLYQAARMLNLGPKKLYRALRARQVLDKNNLPYRRYTDQGLFTTELKSYPHPTLGDRLYAIPHVTQKGLKWLAQQFDVQITHADKQPTNAQGAIH